ncbi:MAG: UDP-N-acetylmuramoyl-L-alanyl-D-glutamate--2,6-diaminopimelate ligase [Gammaproteobacteria bacterium]|jgi:UDP-N-acetylmuramoyl-L-alanyl-D-glutamate--2,6-diaminopimelate ligase|nr:UDP-N-acetylmuramoyl-L-alanyl-D-glutamate--2,6-diaminopimelate ligase [Gammaproteobacteria bacterium]
MKLQQLLQDLTEYCEGEDNHVVGLSLNTKQLQPGELFIAIPGHSNDGRSYINDAIANGARAIVVEADGLAAFSYQSSSLVPVIPIKNLSAKLDIIATRFYNDPSRELQVTGVTGTNGKTTTCYLLAQALSRLGISCGVMGTLGFGFIDSLQDCQLTTPDAISLQKYLKNLKDKGAKAVGMEVSSHGLAQARVNSVQFKSAIFTNLTQDHLDYHGNMHEYGRAKQKLFQFPSLERAVVNGDSEYCQKILQAMRRDFPVVVYTLNKTLADIPRFQKSSILPITTKNIELEQKGMSAIIETPWGKGKLKSPLLGQFNLSNLLGVLAELCLQECDFEAALHALSHAHAAPGRMQRLGGVRTPQVIIDYAHTPDALENALKSARTHCRRRLWCVFGCGGDRDKDKRAKMGGIAATYADRVVVTSDNPRTEDPMQIIEDILQGVELVHSEKIVVEENRESAIEYAISHTLAVDTILIAGKGHEDYQIIGQTKFPFSDAHCVNKLLSEDQSNEAIGNS